MAWDLRAALVDAGHVDRVKPAPTRSAVPAASPSMTSLSTTLSAPRHALRDCVGASPTPMRPSGRRAEAAGFGNAAITSVAGKADGPSPRRSATQKKLVLMLETSTGAMNIDAQTDAG